MSLSLFSTTILSMVKEEPLIHEFLPLHQLQLHLDRTLPHRRNSESVREPVAPIALIDIDSTILDTGPRNMAILREAGEIFPSMEDLLSTLTTEELGWNLPDAVADRAGMNDDERARLWSFWRDRFFRNEYLHFDEPYPGAAGFLNFLEARGLRLIYLTGRDRPNMSRGTVESFIRYQLPFADEDDFIFKPSQNELDLVFKERALLEIEARGDVVLALENEPANANRMQRRFSRALVMLIETITTPDPEKPDPKILRFSRYPLL